MYFWKYILAKKAGLSQKKCNMALYGLPVLPIAEAFEKTVTGNPISVSDALAQDALSLQASFTPTQDGTPSIDSKPTTEPYLSKVVPRGNKEYFSLVGGTVAWNQLAWNVSAAAEIYGITRTKVGSVGAELGLKYSGTSTNTTNFTAFQIINPASNHKYYITLGADLPSGCRVNFVNTDRQNFCIINSGSSTADRTVGVYINNGTEVDFTIYPQYFDLTQMFGTTIADYAYSLEQSSAGSGIAWLKPYGFFTEDYYPYNPGELISVNTSGHKVGSTTYPIDPTDLRGLFKLSNGKLYCEGDTYPPSGSVERNFEYRAYQSGDESLADAITDGTHTVAKRATPTTESATPYTSPIDVETGGTEEFVDNRTVPIPVGNETYYASEYEIHGKTGVTVSHGATQGDTPTEYEVEFTSQGTVYGGTVDIVSGELTVTWGYIASYNGETLTGIWMSSKDVYAKGTTPSTGAEVAYELATPLTYQLTPQQVQMLLNDNYLTTEDGTITLTYMAGK